MSPNHVLYRSTVWMASLSVVIWSVTQAREFLVPLCVSALLAMLMAPIVRYLRRMRLNDTASVTLAVILLYLPLLGIASLVLIEADGLVRNWPLIYASARATLERVMNTPLIAGIVPGQYLDLEYLQGKVTERAGESAMLVLTGLQTLLSAGTSTLLVLSFAAMMLYGRRHLRRSFEHVMSIGQSPAKARTLDGALGVLQDFLVARVLIIGSVAIADFIILKSFGVPYSVTLSAILGLSTLVPVVGYFIGLVPPLIVAVGMNHSGLYLLFLLLALGGVASAQDHILTPALLGRKLNLNFLATYIAIFAGEQIWGLWGMFLSIPALGLLRVLLSASDDLKPWANLLEEDSTEKSVEAKIAAEAPKALP